MTNHHQDLIISHKQGSVPLSSLVFSLALSLQDKYQRCLNRDCRGNCTQLNFYTHPSLLNQHLSHVLFRTLDCVLQDVDLVFTLPKSPYFYLHFNLSLCRISVLVQVGVLGLFPLHSHTGLCTCYCTCPCPFRTSSLHAVVKWEIGFNVHHRAAVFVCVLLDKYYWYEGREDLVLHCTSAPASIWTSVLVGQITCAEEWSCSSQCFYTCFHADFCPYRTNSLSWRVK